MACLKCILSTRPPCSRLGRSSSTGWDLAGKIKEGTVWITKNKAQIVSVIQKVESALLKLASVWLKWVRFLLKGIGYLIGGLARVIDLAALTARGMAALGIISDGTAQSVTDLAGKANSLTDGIGETSAALDRTSKYLDNLSTDADTASTRTKALADALKQVKSKKVRLSIEMTITDVQAAIDAARATGRHQDSAVALLQDWAIDAGSVYKRAPHGLRKRREGARSL